MRLHVLIFLLVLGLGAGLCVGTFILITHWLEPAPATTEITHIHLAGGTLHVRHDLIVHDASARTDNGFVDLRLNALDLTAPLASAHRQDDITLHITAADPNLDPADRASLLYPRFLQPTIGENEAGLRVQHFDDESAYGGDVLYSAPPEGRVFAARCMGAHIQHQNIHTPCLFYFRIGRYDIEARFAQPLLSQWQQLQQALRDFMMHIQSPPEATEQTH
jgi:hypothetical protein